MGIIIIAQPFIYYICWRVAVIVGLFYFAEHINTVKQVREREMNKNLRHCLAV